MPNASTIVYTKSMLLNNAKTMAINDYAGKRRGSVYYGNSVRDYEEQERAGGAHL
jgi:hypothetical protein